MSNLDPTVWEECLEATIDIWDDRDAYIRAVLKRLGIDPAMPWFEYEQQRQS